MKLEETLINLCPKSLRLPATYYYQKLRKRLEKEVLYLDCLLEHGSRAIDIGANQGIYSYALSKKFDVVEAFEPQVWCTEAIVDYSKFQKKNINVHNIGLSDFNGSLTLHLPVNSNDYSSLVPGLGGVVTGLGSFRELEGEQACVEVPVRKLDEYNFADVSFIKIDVEGHESKVIEGSRNTLLKEKPIILIEIEQRHLVNQHIDKVFEQICDLGYEGSFLHRDNFVPLSKFSYRVNQEPFLNNLSSEDYIRNFIFKPVSRDQVRAI